MRFVGDALRILDFDVECRPLSWYGGDWVTKEITAISWKWLGTKGAPVCVLRGEGELDHDEWAQDVISMLENFRAAYDVADMVTGHYIRGFDLPLLNGACFEVGLPPLDSKLSQDTKLDLYRMQGLSKSQENLGAMLGLRHEKVNMTQEDWREANRLTKAGIAKTRKRVTGDVLQHIELRDSLLESGFLAEGRVWTPKPSGKGGYSA